MVGDADLRADVVILGGGFGGLACARELGRAGIDTLLIDRRNHNLFQPLLYQVATAALSPADISEPIRRTLGRLRSVRVVLGECDGIDTTACRVHLRDGRSVGFARLVIATGSEYTYFGHEDWPAHAPGLKTVHEARTIRQRLLLGYERAETSPDPAIRSAALTTVIVGGGPTGVEMAGAISELGRDMIARDFRHLSPEQVRVILVEAGPRLLAGFPEELSDYTERILRGRGVEVMVHSSVQAIRDQSVTIAEEEIACSCIVWAAGVKPSPAARWLGIEAGPQGKVPVGPDLRVTGLPAVFALGDTAYLAQDGHPLPALAQVAKQQGRWLGRMLVAEASGKAEPRTFRFRNRGNTAVIGRNAAIFDFGRWRLKGRTAWFLWAAVHVVLLVNFEKRALVTLQWTFRYLTRQRGARLIDEDPRLKDDASA